MSFVGVVRRLVKNIKERQIDIVQTFFEDSIFIGFFGKIISNQPLLLLSSRRDIGLGKDNQPWYHSLFSIALPWVNRYFDAIIANSEQVRLYVSKREKVSLGKIKVIHNGVLIPDPPSKTRLVISSQDTIVKIGLVASLTPVKRHDVLIKALAELVCRSLRHSFQVYLLGDGPERGHLNNLVSEFALQEHIHFVGAVKDVASYLYDFDIGVLCSDREGLSNAILEYMANGLPVVATAVGGNIELVDEKNGICVPPGDFIALADALQVLINDAQLRKKLGGGSLQKIQQFFSWEKSMAELENYYLDFIEHRL